MSLKIYYSLFHFLPSDFTFIVRRWNHNCHSVFEQRSSAVNGSLHYVGIFNQSVIACDCFISQLSVQLINVIWEANWHLLPLLRFSFKIAHWKLLDLHFIVKTVCFCHFPSRASSALREETDNLIIPEIISRDNHINRWNNKPLNDNMIRLLIALRNKSSNLAQ